MPRSLSRISSATMSSTSECDSPAIDFVGDQELRLGRHGARELELAHLDLREVARQLVGLVGERRPAAAARRSARRSRPATACAPRPRVDGVEQRHAQVLGDRQARERPRQLEAARHAAVGALVRGSPSIGCAVEAHGAGLVVQRAADAVDQRRLAGAVGADQAEALARRDREVDAVERDEAAEALAQTCDFEQRPVITSSLLRMPALHQADDAVRRDDDEGDQQQADDQQVDRRGDGDGRDLLQRCRAGSRRSAGPTQLVVPPIIGMAIELTAYSRPNAERRLEIADVVGERRAGHAHQRAGDRGGDQLEPQRRHAARLRPRARRRGWWRSRSRAASARCRARSVSAITDQRQHHQEQILDVGADDRRSRSAG